MCIHVVASIERWTLSNGHNYQLDKSPMVPHLRWTSLIQLLILIVYLYLSGVWLNVVSRINTKMKSYV